MVPTFASELALSPSYINPHTFPGEALLSSNFSIIFDLHHLYLLLLFQAIPSYLNTIHLEPPTLNTFLHSLPHLFIYFYLPCPHNIIQQPLTKHHAPSSLFNLPLSWTFVTSSSSFKIENICLCRLFYPPLHLLISHCPGSSPLRLRLIT